MGSSESPEERRLADADISMPGDRVVNIAEGRPVAAPEQGVSRTTVWLHRLSLVIFVIFCIELGMLLAVLPWTPVWSNNGLLADSPVLKAVLQGNFIRGLVTGCGLVDIWIGIWEAVHYKDPK